MSAVAPAAEKVPCEEDILPTREEAAELLEACRVTHTRVVRVTTDGAILYVRGNPGNQWPMTAWIEQEDGPAAVRVESGWPVQENDDLSISPRVAGA